MSWKKTNEAGIYRHTETGAYRVLATAKSPLDGKMKQRRVTLDPGATMGEAITVREEVKAEIRTEGAELTVESKSITLFGAQWLARQIKSGRWEGRTASCNKQNLRDHILPVIGHIPVDGLTRDHVRGWIEYAESAMIEIGRDKKPLKNPRPYAHKSIRRWWAMLLHLLKDLYLEGHIERRLLDWARSQPGPRAPHVPIRRESQSLTAKELVRLTDVCRRELSADRWAEYITIVHTGMRPGEVFGLDWESVDFSKRVITIQQSHSQGELGPPKNGETRYAPMTEVVAEALQEHRRELLRLGNTGLHDGIVFPSRVGGRRDATSMHKPLRRCAELAGISVRVGPQVLRYTHITLSYAAGLPPEHIRALTGHQTLEMSEHYTRPRLEDLAATSTKMWG